MRKWFVFLLGGLLLCFAGVSCKDDSKKGGGTKTGPCDDIGAQNECECESGDSGLQICIEAGSWSPCSCGEDTASVSESENREAASISVSRFWRASAINSCGMSSIRTVSPLSPSKYFAFTKVLMLATCWGAKSLVSSMSTRPLASLR